MGNLFCLGVSFSVSFPQHFPAVWDPAFPFRRIRIDLPGTTKSSEDRVSLHELLDRSRVTWDVSNHNHSELLLSFVGFHVIHAATARIHHDSIPMQLFVTLERLGFGRMEAMLQYSITYHAA